MYSPYNLKSTDPPQWSFVLSSSSSSSTMNGTDNNNNNNNNDNNCNNTSNIIDLMFTSIVDPCNVSTSNLTQISPEHFQIPLGWTYLHDFMFTCYPSRDICGWQYSNDFDSNNKWISSQIIPNSIPKEVYIVRRRLWIRTLVKENNIQDCRNVFEKYIQNHPRGNILSTKIYRQSHYRKRWCAGTALLTDKSLHISLDDNYQQNINYNLKGCEVSVLTLKLQDSQIPTSSHIHNQPARSNYISSLPFLGCHHLPKKWFLFGLKYISTNNSNIFQGTKTTPSGSFSAPITTTNTTSTTQTTTTHTVINNNNNNNNNSNSK